MSISLESRQNLFRMMMSSYRDWKYPWKYSKNPQKDSQSAKESFYRLKKFYLRIIGGTRV